MHTLVNYKVLAIPICFQGNNANVGDFLLQMMETAPYNVKVTYII